MRRSPTRRAPGSEHTASTQSAPTSAPSAAHDGAQAPTRQSQAAAWARRVRPHLPLALLVVLAAGALLRLAAAVFYEPMVLTMSDSTAYIWAAAGNLYADATRPAGYSLFLRMGHVASEDVQFTIGLQHLLGLASAVLLYLTTRRLGASRWVATIPAAAVALSGDQIVIEHTLLTEAPFTLLLCAAVYAAVRSLDSSRPYVWASGAGLAIGGASTVRTVGLVVVPLIAVWIGLCVPGEWRRRLLAGGAALVAGITVLGVYAGFQDRSQGTWSLGRTSGWGLYSRVAPFADCNKFTPPDGTRFLCETTPPEQRSGPDFYGWVGGPARDRFGGPPNGNDQLNEFARAVVLHQPLDYTEAVAKDTMRYFVPTFGFDRPAGGVGPDLFLLDRRAPGYEEKIEEVVESYYDPFTLQLSPGGVRALTDYQELFRVHGILLLEFLLLGVAGVFVARGRVRQGLILLLGVSLALLIVPAATTLYSARYTLPVEGLAAAAAALAGAAVVARLRAPRQQPAD